MGKRIRDYVKYSVSELEQYTKTTGSCVKKLNNLIHLHFPPYGLSNFRETLLQIIAQKKIGFYDARLQGIILDVRNIKVLGDTGALRFDDPAIHLNIETDSYVFQPQVGAIVKGTVKHIAARHIGVIIYRVFSVTIRLGERIQQTIEQNSEIEFRIKRFDLQNAMPFIEGELVSADGMMATSEEPAERKPKANKTIVFAVSSDDEQTEEKPKVKKEAKFEHGENGSSGYNSDGSHSKRTTPRKLKRSNSDSDTSVKDERNDTKSPDIFDGLNDFIAEVSDIETHQNIKRELQSQMPSKKSNYPETIVSDSDSSSQSRQKTIRHKSVVAKKHKSPSKLNDTMDSIRERVKSESSDTDSSRKRKRKRTISIESIPAVKKPKSPSLRHTESSTTIVLDTDIEDTITTPKKRSKKAHLSSFTENQGNKEVKVEFLDPNESLNSTKSKKKKSKSKDESSSSLNSSVNEIFERMRSKLVSKKL